uniref:Kinase n=1 Tax=Fundulus heteroclitus TaxID=8078 RepID=A0A3Q2NRA7_FUNHE
MEIEDTDSCTGLSDETHQHLSISDGPSGSCTAARGSFRPRLLATKSFPPYSQCIGGLGEDLDWDNDPDSELLLADAKEETTVEVREANDSAKYSREVVRARWRSRRKERLGGSFEVGTDGCERGRWSGKRRVEESGTAGEDDDEERDEGKHWRGRSSSLERDGSNEEKEGRKPSSTSGAQGDNSSSTETPEGHNEDSDVMMEPSSHRHPILSKLLHSSTSSCSSINLSSESDEVFSDVDDAVSKRQTFRKVRAPCSGSTRSPQKIIFLCDSSTSLLCYALCPSFPSLVLKLYSELEAKCLDCLMRDALRPFVPQYHGLVTRGEHCYIRLEDLLNGLRRPVIMDCKMGHFPLRTFQEEELIKARTKPSPRSDMYQKMLKIDPSAPTAEEHAQKGVTKWRYLQWRDTTSSTSTLGFRIEGIMMEDGSVQPCDVWAQSVATETQICDLVCSQNAYHSRLLDLKDALRVSEFFQTHEVIGSSLLFVHDHNKASVWMIDFGKTMPLPDSRELQHGVPWVEGSREDGYLIGLTSILTALSQAISVAEEQQGAS